MNSAKIYEIKINAPKDGVGGAVRQDEPGKALGKTKSNAEVQDKSLGKTAKAAIGTVATIYATSQLIVKPLIRNETDKLAISGDFVQAEAIQRVYNNVNQAVGLGMEAASIAVAFMINPMLGGVALMGSGIKHITAEINRRQDNQLIAGLNKVDNFVYAYDRARMIDVKVGD